MAGYGDDTKFQAWLDSMGYTLPATAPTLAVLRERGSAYLDATYGPRFKGLSTGGYDQERAWPRIGAVVSGSLIPDSSVPSAVERASYMAAWADASSPGSLSGGASSGTGVVRRQKVGEIEREFFEAKQEDGQVYDPLAPSAATKIIADIDNLLKPYIDLQTTVQGVGLWTVGPGC